MKSIILIFVLGLSRLTFAQEVEFNKKTNVVSINGVESFIIDLLAPNVDARLFEIVSYSILKFYYHDQEIIWGYEMENLNRESLKLYKTGRTNANDGGIDFVMKPLGRFFQVTETLDFKKYFISLDKIFGDSVLIIFIFTPYIFLYLGFRY